jgi:hypothetical protein
MPIEPRQPFFKIAEVPLPIEEKYELFEVINGSEVVTETEIMDAYMAAHLNRGLWFKGDKKRWRKSQLL